MSDPAFTTVVWNGAHYRQHEDTAALSCAAGGGTAALAAHNALYNDEDDVAPAPEQPRAAVAPVAVPQISAEPIAPAGLVSPDVVAAFDALARALGLAPVPTATTMSVTLPAEGMALDDIEKEALTVALRRAEWVQKDAAALLRISPRMMKYKMQNFGIQRPGGAR